MSVSKSSSVFAQGSRNALAADAFRWIVASYRTRAIAQLGLVPVRATGLAIDRRGKSNFTVDPRSAK